MMDLSKFTSKKKILSKVATTNFVAKLYPCIFLFFFSFFLNETNYVSWICFLFGQNIWGNSFFYFSHQKKEAVCTKHLIIQKKEVPI